MKSHPASTAYRLYADSAAVSYLQWRSDVGWQLWQRGQGWQAIAEEPEPVGALDAAADVLLGPSEPSTNVPRVGRYELHAYGLAPDVVPIAFPETITLLTGDVSVLAGEFEDEVLCRIVRRVALLGGGVLALFEEKAS
ncbi:hypothetical protein OJ997_33490 [Solirubrobacter phytolaccae]|uniref:Uncharacterized protein n=1 Tax=Solirubrobacter phytolaccae TaxID=1404360 RepID=A0A9X3SJH2_9ACTN|nr:hypothetical protein [Solirubrobacter phytolaccae]MDA0185267.1 hypothetical protein [Solirubrobacter phytolaccae]